MTTILTNYLEQLLHGADVSISHHQFVYRGQSDAAWPLESSAVRRLGSSASNESLIEYNRELIGGFRDRRFDTDGERALTDLEVLAHLQHLDAATSLVDFSRNPLIALWFACQEQAEGADGRVFKLDVTFCLEHDPGRPFEDCRAQLIPPVNLLAWQPPHVAVASERVLAQHSVMVLGPDLVESVPQRDVVSQVEIPEVDKNELQQALASVGVDESSLFPDSYGYAYTHRSSRPRRTLSASEGLGQAAHNFNRGEYSSASELYARYIQERSGNVEIEVRLSLANTLVAQGKNDEALEVLAPFETSIDEFFSPTRFALLLNIANILASLGKHDEALERYSRVTSDSQLGGHMVQFNRANSLFATGRYREAIEGYEQCTDYAAAFYNCANAHIALGQLDESEAKLVQATGLPNASSHCGANLDVVRSVRALIGHNEYRIVLTPVQNSRVFPFIIIIVRDQQIEGEPRIFPVAGNVGNQGNLGVPLVDGEVVHGGPGYEGFDGGAIMVVSEAGFRSS